MGSDDLHHKRKAKAAASLERRIAMRSSYDKVLIVCEGEKTEPNYFNDLIEFYKLNTANVAVDGACGSSPKSVFNHAVELCQKEDRKGDSFDRVYCVFDKDTHETYGSTMAKISSYNPAGFIYAAVSIPCFEYWLLLHFKYTTRQYVGTGALSIGGMVLKDLKDVFPEYDKGRKDVFSDLIHCLDFAKNNAKRSLEYANDNHTDNPSTYIHELVDYLQRLEAK